MQSPRWMEVSLGLAFLVILMAAYVASEDYIRLNTPVTTRIYNVTDEEGGSIKSTLEKMHPPARSKISMIIVVGEIDRKSSGQCFQNPEAPSSIIILERKYLKTTVVWHEAIHAHFSTLPEEAREEWRALGIRPKYLDEAWEGELIFGQYPHDGIVSAYGRKNEYEDVATWGEALYSKLNGVPSRLDRSFDKDNPIYPKILAWFLRWNFISQAQYETLHKQLFP